MTEPQKRKREKHQHGKHKTRVIVEQGKDPFMVVEDLPESVRAVLKVLYPNYKDTK